MDQATTLIVALVAMGGAATVLWAFLRWPIEVLACTWLVTIAEATASVYFPPQLAAMVKTIDEPLLMVVFAGSLVFHRRNRSVGRWYVMLPAAGVLYAGWSSVAIQGVPPAAAALGTWQAMKFWTLLYIVVRLPWTSDRFDRIFRFMGAVALVVVGLAAFEFLAPGLFRSLVPVANEGLEERFGATGLQAVFTHPGHFGSFATIFASVFLADFIQRGDRRALFASAFTLMLAVMSLRLKVVLGFAGALLALLIASPSRVLQRAGALLLVVALGVFFGGGVVTQIVAVQLDRYLLSDDETIREVLYQTSREIAADEVPFGRGFGQFGTGAATTYASPVYEEYGLGSRPGLSQENPDIRHDTTWPTVLGETGYLGLASFLGGIAAIWYRLLRGARDSSRANMRRDSTLALTALSCVMLESLGRPSFFNAVTTLTIALLVGGPLALTSGRHGYPARASSDRRSDPATSAA